MFAELGGVSEIAVRERLPVAVESSLETAFRESDIFFLLGVGLYRSFINDALIQAVSFNRAYVVFPAVACPFIFSFALEELVVVAFNGTVDVRHTPGRHFHCVSVEDFP